MSYARDPETSLAPPSLEKIHPLGKSPVVRDGDAVVHESGAIIDYVLRTHGDGRLAPPPSSPEHTLYQQWMHYAEGSAVLPLILKLYLGRLGGAGDALAPRVGGEIHRHMGYLDGALAGREWFVGDALSAADIQLSFPIQLARMLHGIDAFANLSAFLDRIAARPAYHRAVERGGPYALGPPA